MKKCIKKQKKRKINKRRDQETKPEHTQAEWVLCSEDWRNIVIKYVLQINNIAIEDNYTEISQEEIKKAYKQYKRRAQMKGAT